MGLIVMSNMRETIRGSEEMKIRARQLRKQATPAEKILWEQLRNRRLIGIKFRRQHVLGRYIVDFFCPAKHIAIKLDGEIHRYQEEDDLNRTINLEEMGVKVIRFRNKDVEQDLDTVLVKIAESCTLPYPTSGRRAGDEGDF